MEHHRQPERVNVMQPQMQQMSAPKLTGINSIVNQMMRDQNSRTSSPSIGGSQRGLSPRLSQMNLGSGCKNSPRVLPPPNPNSMEHDFSFSQGLAPLAANQT